eukprot:5094094-Prorocentrum_lima.AAC.1
MFEEANEAPALAKLSKRNTSDTSPIQKGECTLTSRGTMADGCSSRTCASSMRSSSSKEPS